MSHVPEYDAKFLKALGEMDAKHAEEVHRGGCPECGGALDRADYPRKPRGELGEAEGEYDRRRSFCCRVDGCRKRATPASLRFLGRKVYIAVVVIVASVAGRTMALTVSRHTSRVRGVPSRTVRRWLCWWQTVFAMGAFWSEAKALFAMPVTIEELPASLLARFGEGTRALERMLRFTAPITTTNLVARTAMVP